MLKDVELVVRAAAYAQLGRQEEARAAMAEYLKLRPGRTLRTVSRLRYSPTNTSRSKVRKTNLFEGIALQHIDLLPENQDFRFKPRS